jgi:hypothetical protein
VKLITYLHLVPRLRMRGAIPPLPECNDNPPAPSYSAPQEHGTIRTPYEVLYNLMHGINI